VRLGGYFSATIAIVTARLRLPPFGLPFLCIREPHSQEYTLALPSCTDDQRKSDYTPRRLFCQFVS